MRPYRKRALAYAAVEEVISKSEIKDLMVIIPNPKEWRDAFLGATKEVADRIEKNSAQVKAALHSNDDKGRADITKQILHDSVVLNHLLKDADTVIDENNIFQDGIDSSYTTYTIHLVSFSRGLKIPPLYQKYGDDETTLLTDQSFFPVFNNLPERVKDRFVRHRKGDIVPIQ